eukprot:jgi/Ulvmu1/9320/UM050_0069.1
MFPPPIKFLAAFVVPTLWMASSTGLILLNKHLMMEKGFAYPITLSGLGQAFSGVAALICCRVLRIVVADKPVSWRFFCRRMLPVGLFNAMTLMFGNAVYLFLSVAFIQMLKAFTPVITMLGLFLVSLETPTSPLIASVCIIAAGTALAGYGELHMSVAGMLIQLVSESAEAGRLIMTQTLLQGLSFHPIESLLYIAPASVAWMLVVAAVAEFPEIVQNGGLTILVQHAPLFFLAASLGFVVTTLAFFTIQLCGSLTLKVLGTVKNATLVAFCVIFLGEQVTGIQGLGYSVSMAGFTWYQLVKMGGRPSPPPSTKQEYRTSDADAQLGGRGSLERLLDRVGSNEQLRGKVEA